MQRITKTLTTTTLLLTGCSSHSPYPSSITPSYSPPPPSYQTSPQTYYSPPPVAAPPVPQTYAPPPSPPVSQPLTITVEPRTSTPPATPRSVLAGKTYQVQSLTAQLSNINDFGVVMIQPAGGRPVVAAQAEWTYGIKGSKSVPLDDFIKQGSNLVVFALYNKKGKGISTRFYNKDFLTNYSYDFTLLGDGSTLFHMADNQKEGQQGIAAWSAYGVERNGAQFKVGAISPAQTSQLEAAFRHINDDLTSNPVAETSTDIAAQIAIGIHGANHAL